MLKGYPGATPISVGAVIDDKFRVEMILGTGGMGIVAKAVNLRLGTPVALKFLLPQALADSVVVERFLREGQAAARLTSDHVARVLDVGSLQDGQPYLVMEFLDGETVGAALQRRGTIPVPEACAIMVEACEGLAEAHGLGIVHRDFKPANLFLAKRPNKTIVKVLDFGISKIQGEEFAQKELTKTSSFLGTPHYMAPEQFVASRAVDTRADIWSCGVCLFRMLSGQFPFDADGVIQLGVKIMGGDPLDLNEVLPDAPPALAAIIRRCLARDPNARWPSVAALAKVLVPFAQSGVTPMDLASDMTEPTPQPPARSSANVPRTTAKMDLVPPSAPVLRVEAPTAVMHAAYPAPRQSERVVEANTSGGFGRTHVSGAPPRAPARATSILIAAGAALLVVLGFVGFRVLRSSEPEPPPPVAATEPPPAPTPTPTPTPTPVVSAAPTESAAPIETATAVTKGKARPTKKPPGEKPPSTATAPAAPKPTIPDER